MIPVVSIKDLIQYAWESIEDLSLILVEVVPLVNKIFSRVLSYQCLILALDLSPHADNVIMSYWVNCRLLVFQCFLFSIGNHGGKTTFLWSS